MLQRSKSCLFYDLVDKHSGNWDLMAYYNTNALQLPGIYVGFMPAYPGRKAAGPWEISAL